MPCWAEKWAVIELANRGGAEAHEARVLVVAGLRNGGEQLGVEDRADLAADIVEHAVGVNGAVALAEDDVAFHVDFERQSLACCVAPLKPALASMPQTTTRSVSISTSPSGPSVCGRPSTAETLDDDVHAAADDDDRFARRATGDFRNSGPGLRCADESLLCGSWSAAERTAGGGTVCGSTGVGRSCAVWIGGCCLRRRWREGACRRMVAGGCAMRELQIAKCKMQIADQQHDACADASAAVAVEAREHAWASSSVSTTRSGWHPCQEKCARCARAHSFTG